ncbi:hypothetical protein Pelo_9003 [Pelomyxa schiedti]|nr:hypothetical protein Pelo_9003 [Pelomyxa schiedti]
MAASSSPPPMASSPRSLASSEDSSSLSSSSSSSSSSPCGSPRRRGVGGANDNNTTTTTTTNHSGAGSDSDTYSEVNVAGGGRIPPMSQSQCLGSDGGGGDGEDHQQAHYAAPTPPPEQESLVADRAGAGVIAMQPPPPATTTTTSEAAVSSTATTTVTPTAAATGTTTPLEVTDSAGGCDNVTATTTTNTATPNRMTGASELTGEHGAGGGVGETKPKPEHVAMTTTSTDGGKKNRFGVAIGTSLYTAILHGSPLLLASLALAQPRQCDKNIRLYLLLEIVLSGALLGLNSSMYWYYLRNVTIKQGFDRLSKSPLKVFQSLLSLGEFCVTAWGARLVNAAADCDIMLWQMAVACIVVQLLGVCVVGGFLRSNNDTIYIYSGVVRVPTNILGIGSRSYYFPVGSGCSVAVAVASIASYVTLPQARLLSTGIWSSMRKGQIMPATPLLPRYIDDEPKSAFPPSTLYEAFSSLDANSAIAEGVMKVPRVQPSLATDKLVL